MNININDTVTVGLTPYGVKVVKEYYAKYGIAAHDISRLHETDEYVTYQSELWELMQIFGPCLYMGCISMPFVDNIIRTTW